MAQPRFWSGQAIGIAALVAGALVWEIGAQFANPAFVAPFSTTAARMWEYAASGTLTDALASSLAIYVSGMAYAIVVGVGLGLLLARARLLRIGLESYIMILYSTPMVALIPFILSMMGFGFAPKVLVVFLFAVFSVLYNTLEGARSLKPELLEVARSFRSSEYAVWRDILVPYTLPFAMTGIRQGIGRGLVGLVSAEFFLSGSGIGLLIIRSGQDFDVPGLYGAIMVITILGVALMAIGRTLENRFAAWRGLS
ncbi:MAG: binding-protein-dependent transport system inner rane component [Hyphomicrobiales bacterium]|jgi:ABC-type nitrate/sulfonate/bicarbonate transport system permease component|nr:binding-protein-dependent transport system inner rane component [Hyphomicrobiales bacterium]